MGKSHLSAWSHAIRFELERALREILGCVTGAVGLCVFVCSFCSVLIGFFYENMFSSDKYTLSFFQSLSTHIRQKKKKKKKCLVVPDRPPLFFDPPLTFLYFLLIFFFFISEHFKR